MEVDYEKLCSEVDAMTDEMMKKKGLKGKRIKGLIIDYLTTLAEGRAGLMARPKVIERLDYLTELMRAN
jgi:hypothetical protein